MIYLQMYYIGNMVKLRTAVKETISKNKRILRLSLKTTSQDPRKLKGNESRTRRRRQYEDDQFQVADLLAKIYNNNNKKRKRNMNRRRN